MSFYAVKGVGLLEYTKRGASAFHRLQDIPMRSTRSLKIMKRLNVISA